jgi:large conductance mechanosensitive channel
MLKEFKAFAMRGNVVDLAVGVIIGGAFGKIVGSFVGDIVMPIINPLIPGGDWKTIEIGPGIKLGSFLGTVLDFLIIAFVIVSNCERDELCQEERRSCTGRSGSTSCRYSVAN